MLTNLLYVLIFSSLLSLSLSSSSLKGFNLVRDFGAKNDGRSDATHAFLKAWNAACASSTPSEIYAPPGDYILNHIMFEGPCKTGILFRIDGTLHASGVYSKDHWIDFHNVDGLHIKGGVLDAKGSNLWNCKLGRGGCPVGAKSLSIDNSKNIIVDGVTSRNSQMFHIAINGCENINIGGLIVIADADSPNTDGIHVENSKGVTIMHSQFMTGDDCISLGPYTRNIWIENIFCGPGHGISIGSLGRKSDEGVFVQNVTVKSATLMSTDNGLRIKTFGSPVKGIVKDIYFLGATMINVRNPIIIDQNYCPQSNCGHNEGSGIQISNVVYKGISGISSSPEILTLDCSPRKPCNNLKLQDINLSYQSGKPICAMRNAYLTKSGYIKPSYCLAK